MTLEHPKPTVQVRRIFPQTLESHQVLSNPRFRRSARSAYAVYGRAGTDQQPHCFICQSDRADLVRPGRNRTHLLCMRKDAIKRSAKIMPCCGSANWKGCLFKTRNDRPCKRLRYHFSKRAQAIMSFDMVPKMVVWRRHSPALFVVAFRGRDEGPRRHILVAGCLYFRLPFPPAGPTSRRNR